MKNIQLHGMAYTPNAFDSLVLEQMDRGILTNAYIIAHSLGATRSRATRDNIAASLERLVAAGFLEREDLAVQDLAGKPLAAPVYRRIRL